MSYLLNPNFCQALLEISVCSVVSAYVYMISILPSCLNPKKLQTIQATVSFSEDCLEAWFFHSFPNVGKLHVTAKSKKEGGNLSEKM